MRAAQRLLASCAILVATLASALHGQDGQNGEERPDDLLAGRFRAADLEQWVTRYEHSVGLDRQHILKSFIRKSPRSIAGLIDRMDERNANPEEWSRLLGFQEAVISEALREIRDGDIVTAYGRGSDEYLAPLTYYYRGEVLALAMLGPLRAGDQVYASWEGLPDSQARRSVLHVFKYWARGVLSPDIFEIHRGVPLEEHSLEALSYLDALAPVINPDALRWFCFRAHDATVRSAAAKALTYRPTREAVRLLCQMATDTEDAVRKASLESLETLLELRLYQAALDRGPMAWMRDEFFFLVWDSGAGKFVSTRHR